MKNATLLKTYEANQRNELYQVQQHVLYEGIKKLPQASNSIGFNVNANQKAKNKKIS